ncbi:MAG: exodeoxyribonuclease VII large subunit [Lachnospiraceae bacterium]|nr:exodeoxyribonuclease VII large subunit [Lachnospiraceae bacterium]
MKRRTYSVAQVNKYIYGLLDNEPFLHGIRIEGEVSNLKYHSSGHIYFDLKDASGKLSCAMFRNYRSGLTYRMQEGDNIVATGDVAVYTRNGTYQLVAKYIEEAGAGDLYRRFEQLKKELAEMGMFAEEYKQPLPAFVSHLGIVTAPTGAAVRDIIRIAKRRNPHLRITLYPAQVQGDGATASVVHGIETLNEVGVDVMIIGRGGGSIEDLWAFNEEEVARAIFASRVPVISAVGHETDTTIADFVADRRAATPSEAAELAVAEYDAVIERLDAKRAELVWQMQRRLFEAEQRLDTAKDKLRLLHPKTRLVADRKRLMQQRDRLQRTMDGWIERLRHRLELAAGRLEGISPVKRLAGGYAYLSGEGGKNIRSVSDAAVGDMVAARVTDGVLHMRVEAADPDEKK